MLHGLANNIKLIAVEVVVNHLYDFLINTKYLGLLSSSLIHYPIKIRHRSNRNWYRTNQLFWGPGTNTVSRLLQRRSGTYEVARVRTPGSPHGPLTWVAGKSHHWNVNICHDHADIDKTSAEEMSQLAIILWYFHLHIFAWQKNGGLDRRNLSTWFSASNGKPMSFCC